MLDPHWIIAGVIAAGYFFVHWCDCKEISDDCDRKRSRGKR